MIAVTPGQELSHRVLFRMLYSCEHKVSKSIWQRGCTRKGRKNETGKEGSFRIEFW